MPLSEQEQRMLDEMERHLMGNDADVVSAPQGDHALSYRNIVYGIILVLAGLGAMIVGVAVPLTVVGVIGFLAMLAGVVLAVTPSRTGTLRTSKKAKPGSPDAKPHGSLMDRLNERWDRRQGER